MVLINEWLPNPTGKDAKNEWVELFNSGKTPVNLSGWKITNKAGKSVTLGDFTIVPSSYALVRGVPALKNTDESVSLYDSEGGFADRSAFNGTAVEGKSYSRYGTAFMWATPTPGAPNETNAGVSLINNHYPLGASLAHSYGAGSFVMIAAIIGVVCSAVALLLIKKHGSISHLFFG